MYFLYVLCSSYLCRRFFCFRIDQLQLLFRIHILEHVQVLLKASYMLRILWWLSFLSFLSSSALFQHITALFECTMAAIITLLVSEPVGVLYIRSCRVLMLSDWYTMLYNPSPDYVTTVHCTHEAVYPL